ncbi:MAG: hypothetical protein AAGI23_15740 [Bacteroidota bacterium]
MEYTSAIIGMTIAAVVAFLVAKDAQQRGMNPGLWALGVFALMIVFLPLYLILRKPKVESMD